MSHGFIGCGNFSKYYLYILGTIALRIFRDCIFGFESIDPESKSGLFGFIPELSKHYLLQDFYKYFSFTIGGLIFMNITKKYIMKEDTPHINPKNSFILKGLIHNQKSASSENISIIKILIVCVFYFLHTQIEKIMYLFDFNGLDFWIFDIIFTLFFMDKYYINSYYKHQKYSMLFILIIGSILLIISSFLKNTNNKESNLKDKNTYQIIEYITGNSYIFIFILLIFIILSSIFSYSVVKAKILMHFNYVSPYKIIYYIGLFGLIITFIGLIFVSIFDCKGEKEDIINYCILTQIDNNNNSTKYYYDNIIIYFQEINKNLFNYKFFLEIFLIIPLFFAINFFGLFCEIFTIYYLSPLYVLVWENLYNFIKRFAFILVNLDTFKNYITLKQFCVLQLSEIVALLGYAVYLEIIELRFCDLDKDLKRKIIERGKRDTIIKTTDDNNNDEGNNDLEESFGEDKN